ncbi:ankyrin-1-like [Artemia franciscana]
MMKFEDNVEKLPKLHRICYKGKLKELHAIKEINAELEMVCSNKATPLIYAVYSKFALKFVKYLLRKGANPSYRSYGPFENNLQKRDGGQTPLHHAVKIGRADLCKLLIKSGAELDATNAYGKTPLVTAIKDNNSNLVEILLDRGANPNCGECLHLAVQKGRADLCKLPIDKRKSSAEIDAMNAHGKTPLAIAIKANNLNLVEILLDRGADPNYGECLHYAVEKGRVNICKLLIDFGAKLDAMNAKKDTPLLIAIRNNNLELVIFLLDRGANPNCGECLHLIVQKGRADLCKLLIKSGAELDAANAHGKTPLVTAIKANNLNLVEVLLDRGANPNCGECLHLAVQKGRADLCKLLIKSGAELDATNAHGKTPLVTAIKVNNLNLVEILLDRGANPNRGECLHLAVQKGRADLCKLLIDKMKSSAEIDAMNAHGKTPLATAIKANNLNLVEILLDRGADPNYGECLHHAVKKGRVNICKLLIDFGAKLDAMNAKKDTPLLIAIRNNNLELVILLLDRGANPNCGECLHLFVQKGRADLCKLSIKSGAELDATNAHGKTPLVIAIKANNLNLVKILLDRGADPNCGECLHLAIKIGRVDIVPFLVLCGAKLDAMNAKMHFCIFCFDIAIRNKGRKRRRNAEEHENLILQEKMDLDNATSRKCKVSKRSER